MIISEHRLFSEYNPAFIARNRELKWLFERFTRRSFGRLFVISGLPGVGKTALLKQFLASVRMREAPLVLAADYTSDRWLAEFYAHVDDFNRNRNLPEVVVIDNADALDEQQLNTITARVLNFKVVRMLIFVMRMRPDFARADILQLEPLSMADSQDILRSLLGSDFPPEKVHQAATVAAGLPLAIGLVADLVRGRDPDEIDRLLRGELYNASEQLILPETELVSEVRPQIILVNDTLIERLRRQPHGIYKLPPRKFEELVADLLVDLGYEVELTPATHDGGKDILAQIATPHGKLLCLVEAKKYRADRPVGVALVRQLYGTLIDADATSAMLVTTSYFSREAKIFQHRHKYRLTLHDYGNVVHWIRGYKNK